MVNSYEIENVRGRYVNIQITRAQFSGENELKYYRAETGINLI